MTVTDTTANAPDDNAPHEVRHAVRELLRRSAAMLASVRGKNAAVWRVKAQVAIAARRDARRSRRSALAEEEAAQAEQRASAYGPRIGHIADAGRRVVSLPIYLGILTLAGMLAYNLNKGALLVLLLPLPLTEAIALVAVVLTLAAAHWGGHIMKRRHEVVEDRTVLGRTEITLGLVCVGGGYALMVIVATLRGAVGGLLPGLLFLGLGVLDFTVALVASYFFTNDVVAARNRARRRARLASWYAALGRRSLLRQVARWRTSCYAYRDAASVVVLAADQIRAAGLDTWQRTHAGQPEPTWPEPEWLQLLRPVASGVLPPDLDIRPVLLEAGIPPEDVL